ncbi:MAG: toll/interleukin-1 receptor domain-containing protein, partial [Bacteroidota bacterium]
YPVFLSHSSKDKAFAQKTYEALTNKGAIVWYDEKQLKPGDKIRSAITQGIDTFDKMILICSEASLNSWWVETEIENILQKEEDLRKATNKRHSLLIPIQIDDYVFSPDCPRELQRQIKSTKVGDFREWRNEAIFNQKIDELIAAINVDRKPNNPPSYLGL